MSKFFTSAKFYQSLLWHPIPILPGSKKPAVEWTHYKTSFATDEELKDWFEKNAYQMAVICGQSGLAVIDDDSYKNNGGQIRLASTLTQTTPRGGTHYFYKCPPGLRPSVNEELAVDVRGYDSYVLVAPSEGYKWNVKSELEFLEALRDLPELPLEYLKKIQPEKKPGERFDINTAFGAKQGERNVKLKSAIPSLIQKHDLETAWRLTQALNNTFEPPEDIAELKKLFQYEVGWVKRAQAQQAATPHHPTTHGIVMERVFKPILAKDIKTLSNIDVEWVTEGFLAKGYLSLFAAREKLGKTSLVKCLLKSLITGNNFLGQAVMKSRVLVISEENPGIWNRRLEDMGLSNCDSAWFEMQPFNTKLKQPEWEKWLIEEVAPFCEKNQIEVLIIDTISTIWPVVHENDVGETNSALLPFMAITKKGVAILAIHHDSKAAEIRGSTQIAAVPSILLRFARPQGDEDTTRRILKGRSRFEETPDQLLLDYQDGEYVLLGTPQNVIKQEKLKQVKEALLIFPDGAIITELIGKWEGKKPSRTTLKRWLDELCFTQNVHQIGTKEIEGGKAIIYSLYPNQSENGEGVGILGENEPNNPNHRDRVGNSVERVVEPETGIPEK